MCVCAVSVCVSGVCVFVYDVQLSMSCAGCTSVFPLLLPPPYPLQEMCLGFTSHEFHGCDAWVRIVVPTSVCVWMRCGCACMHQLCMCVCQLLVVQVIVLSVCLLGLLTVAAAVRVCVCVCVCVPFDFVVVPVCRAFVVPVTFLCRVFMCVCVCVGTSG